MNLFWFTFLLQTHGLQNLPSLVPLIFLSIRGCGSGAYALQLNQLTKTMQTHSITLGMNISDSGKVTNQMWLQFLETEVVTRLDYATITDAIGIYKGNVEQSKIISVTVDERTTGSLKIIENLLQVGQTYKTQFRQDSILYQTTEVPTLEFA